MPTRKTPHQTSPHACPPPQGTLVVIGGHEDRTPVGKDPLDRNEYATSAILRRVVQELKLDGPLVVVPIASQTPNEVAQDYLDVFGSLGVKRCEVFDVRERRAAEGEDALRLVNEAAGFMFTGGDQLRLTALLGGTAWLRRLKERYASEPVVIAGTSAGAAAMSTPMIYQGRDNSGMRKDEIHVTTGLQFLHDVAIDTHFVARGRIIRMAQIIATNPACLGLGLEEDTGAVITEGRELEVIGSGVVTVLEPDADTSTNIHEVPAGQPFTIRNLQLHVLSCGQRYTLPMQEWLHA